MKCSGAEALAAALRDNKTLKYLNLYGNIIDVVGAQHLAEFIKRTPALTFLDIGYNRLRDKGMTYIREAMTENANCAI